MYHLVLISKLIILLQIAAHAHTFFVLQFYVTRTQYYFSQTQYYFARTLCYVTRTQCYVFRSDICNPSPGKAAIQCRRNFENL